MSSWAAEMRSDSAWPAPHDLAAKTPQSKSLAQLTPCRDGAEAPPVPATHAISTFEGGRKGVIMDNYGTISEFWCPPKCFRHLDEHTHFFRILFGIKAVFQPRFALASIEMGRGARNRVVRVYR